MTIQLPAFYIKIVVHGEFLPRHRFNIVLGLAGKFKLS